MLGKTHLLAAPLVACAVISSGVANTPAEVGLSLAFASAGTLLPDIDTKSILAEEDSIVGLASSITRKITSHRGITHTVWFSLLWGIAAYYLCMLAIPYMKESICFFGAVLIYLMFHARGKLKKMGGIIAIASFFLIPHAEKMAGFVAGAFTLPDAAIVAGVSVAAGCLSHMVLDTLNRGGIMWLYPVKRKFHLTKIRAGSKEENIVKAALIAASGIWIYILASPHMQSLFHIIAGLK